MRWHASASRQTAVEWRTPTSILIAALGDCSDGHPNVAVLASVLLRRAAPTAVEQALAADTRAAASFAFSVVLVTLLFMVRYL